MVADDGLQLVVREFTPLIQEPEPPNTLCTALFVDGTRMEIPGMFAKVSAAVKKPPGRKTVGVLRKPCAAPGDATNIAIASILKRQGAVPAVANKKEKQASSGSRVAVAKPVAKAKAPATVVLAKATVPAFVVLKRPAPIT